MMLFFRGLLIRAQSSDRAVSVWHNRDSHGGWRNVSFRLKERRRV